MTEREALQRQVALNPEDDTVRLAFADWLDEQEPKEMKCGQCWGKGYIIDTAPYGYGRERETCDACHGDKVIKDPGDQRRAEFIRLQIELATTGLTECRRQIPPGPGAAGNPHRVNCQHCQWCVLAKREHKLLRDYGPRWYQEDVAPLFVPSGCATWSVEGPQPKGWMVLHGLECVQRNPFCRGFIENWTFQGEEFDQNIAKVIEHHPVRTVSLTTWPRMFGHWVHADALATVFPGIKFTFATTAQHPHS